jgi:hypothetical protein
MIELLSSHLCRRAICSLTVSIRIYFRLIPYVETSANGAAVGKVLPRAPFAVAIIAHRAWVFNSPLVPNQLHSTFHARFRKKNAPSQRCEGARGLSGWLSKGPKAKPLPGQRSLQEPRYRCLANRWLGIIWKLWPSRERYDETYHWQQIQRHRRR